MLQVLLCAYDSTVGACTWAPVSGSDPDRFRSHVIQLQGDPDLTRIRAIHHERWIRSGSGGSSAAENGCLSFRASTCR